DVVEGAAGAPHQDGAEKHEHGGPPAETEARLGHGSQANAPGAGPEQQVEADRPVPARQPPIGLYLFRRIAIEPVALGGVGDSAAGVWGVHESTCWCGLPLIPPDAWPSHP